MPARSGAGITRGTLGRRTFGRRTAAGRVGPSIGRDLRRVLLADEPTGSLDFRTGEAIMALLQAVHQSHGLTSIFVTHNHSFARECDRVLELRKGNLQNPADMELQEAEVFQDATRLDGGTYV